MERGSDKPPFFDGSNYPIGRFACPLISRGSIDLSGRYAKILLLLCSNHMPVPLHNKGIGTMQIVELVVCFSRVFLFKSSRESPIVRLLMRSGWGFKASTKELFRSKIDSLRCTSMSTRTSLSLMASPLMPCFLSLRPLSTRYEQTRHSYLKMIMRGHLSFYMP